jgi:hypothetical protein
MASTIPLSGTIAATQPMLGYRPLAFPSLSTPIFEPAVTMANQVLLTILGPPFAWRWNRPAAPISFTCVAGQTDYPKTGMGNFGWIEWAAAQDTDPANLRWYPLEPIGSLGIATEEARPRYISAQYDNASGTITFRLMPAPDVAYPVQFDIQQKPNVFSNSAPSPLAQTWSPIPDEYSHLYTWGFEALGLLLANDQRFTEINSKFVSGLLATHQGLTETQVSIFLGNWFALTGSQQVLSDRLQQGVQARGM